MFICGYISEGFILVFKVGCIIYVIVRENFKKCIRVMLFFCLTFFFLRSVVVILYLSFGRMNCRFYFYVFVVQECDIYVLLQFYRGYGVFCFLILIQLYDVFWLWVGSGFDFVIGFVFFYFRYFQDKKVFQELLLLQFGFQNDIRGGLFQRIYGYAVRNGCLLLCVIQYRQLL